MVAAKFVHTHDDLQKCFEIRRRVFIDEYGIQQDSEFDGKDEKAFHLLVLMDGQPAGTLRILYEAGKHALIGRVAVLKEARGFGIGDVLMRAALSKVASLECEDVLINAMADKVAFYGRYGFVAQKEANFDDGIEHYYMRLKRKDINLLGSCQSKTP
jgi:predicted GNAT family N-acyltransferase